jgi:Ca-activated chloride channel family protein
MKNLLSVVFILFLVFLVSCGDDKSKKNQNKVDALPQNVFTVLAGSELKDLEPFFPLIKQKTGISLHLKYSGTLDGIDMLSSGEKFDAAWFSHAKYLMLTKKELVKASEKTMLSPVIIGIRESKANAFGWKDNPDVTWADIEKKINENKLNFAMTNPTASNTGFSAVIGVVSALSGNPDSIRESDINTAKLQEFFRGMKLTSGSSGWLADAFVREQGRIDAIINYESVLIGLNKDNQLKEKLVLIYPKEGIITADYPLILLNESKGADYRKLVDYLKSSEFQQTMMDSTYRRPVIPEVALSNIFPKNLIVELPFPGTLDVVNSILFSYLDEQRPPASSTFVLDVSGSMKGQRIEDLKKSFLMLCGDDQSLTGKFARFQKRERIDIITFNDRTFPVTHFDLSDQSKYNEILGSIKNFAIQLQAGGGTAIFSAIISGYQNVSQNINADPAGYYSIVLMTDGQNTAGVDINEFERYYNALPEQAKVVKVFPIIFGDADKRELDRIAQITGGKVFDAKKDNLSFVFKQIRGYQ